ncbi:type I DNA topoisomerase [Phormidesmis priestleyi]
MANLLLIESPGKSKKLSQILGAGWTVKASLGHVRELANDGEDSLGFDLLGDRVQCRYEPRGDRGKKILAELRQAVKQADVVYIATDPDREGETIGWHLQQELRLKNPRRVVYSEITPAAVKKAIAAPRSLDQALIDAGRARDCLDKLVGYKGSKHVVWKLNNGAKSMGRVQSATLHLLCQREQEILAFKPQDYWSVWVEYAEGFKAFYRRGVNPTKKAAQSPDDAADGKETPESDRVTSQAEADRLVAIAQSSHHQVVQIERKNTTQSPPPAFITSTLQQAAGAKLRLSPDATMKIAQSLYEAGHITYMRTDSVMLSEQFCAAVRQFLEKHDRANLPNRSTQHRSSQTAQEAHEAIRPTEVDRTPAQLNLSGEAAKLYDLIWNRAVASQCAPAQIAKTRVVTQSGEAHWEARGQILTFPGYTCYWNNLSSDLELPNLQQNQPLTLKQAGSEQKQTQPPPRYTEPKLVQLMERKGIGRPSTYAPTVKTLKDREYVEVIKAKLQPTALGMELDVFLAKALPDLIQPEFTAQMESALDQIAAGKQDWQHYLTNWHYTYFEPALNQAKLFIQTSFQSSHLPTFSSYSAEESSPPKKSPSAKSPTVKSSTKSSATAAKSSGKSAIAKSSKTSSKTSSKPKSSAIKSSTTPVTSKASSYTQRSASADISLRSPVSLADSLTDLPCPVCGALLERYVYTKEGQEKTMLRCTIAENRRGKCKEVAFFDSRGRFWSPKFGELSLEV